MIGILKWIIKNVSNINKKWIKKIIKRRSWWLSQLRSTWFNGIWSNMFIFFEVFVEHSGYLSKSSVILFFVFPSVYWVKNFSVDSFNSLWIWKVENWHSIEFRMMNSTIVNSVNNVSCILNWNSFSNSISSSGPSSIDEPNVSIMLFALAVQ